MALVLHSMGVPAVVTPVAPGGEQKAPGCTTRLVGGGVVVLVTVGRGDVRLTVGTARCVVVVTLDFGVVVLGAGEPVVGSGAELEVTAEVEVADDVSPIVEVLDPALQAASTSARETSAVRV